MTDSSSLPIEPGTRESVPTFDNSVTLVGAARATVSQIWIFNRDTRESHHVLSQVDLVQDELPQLDVPPDWHERLGKNSRWAVYAVSAAVPSRQALDWYDALVRTGVWAPPWRSQPLKAPQALRERLDEPRWPSLVSRSQEPAVPLVARRGWGTRVHHLFCEGAHLQSVLSQSEFGLLSALVKEHEQVDFADVPELLQSAHFFQPVPLIRYVGMRLDVDSDGNDIGIFISIVPRRGAPLEGLQIQIQEERAGAERLLARFRPTQHLYRLPLDEEVGQIRTLVLHDDLGLLLDEGPFAFLKSIHTSLDLHTGERRVQLPARRGRSARTIRIPTTSGDPMVITQGEDSRSALTTLHRMSARRQATGIPKDSERWFQGDRQAAEDALREILGRAKDFALVLDPYFSAGEVREWLPSVATVRARVQVLTSAAGLRSIKHQSNVLTGNRLERKHLKDLQKMLTMQRDAKQINETEVRVMVGKTSPIHDRFLVADKRVWLMGSSLNSFGDHGTMLVELRRSAEVLDEILGAWKRALTLDERLAELKKSAGKAADP